MNLFSQQVKQSKGHNDIGFVDICLNRDTKLFIDPCLIEVGTTTFCRKANVVMQDCMDYLVGLYRRHAPYNEMLKFFDHMHELNCTKLGYGNGNNGKAKTAEGMIETLSDVQHLVDVNIGISHPIDLSLFIEGFAEDCLSDMITNILLYELNEFTLHQCEKYGLETEPCKEKYYHWDANTHEWKRFEENCLYIDGKMVVLVPKNIVHHKYYYNTSQYFGSIVLSRIQKEETTYDNNGKEYKPTKKSLRENMLRKNSDIRNISIEKTIEDTSLLDTYHSGISSAYSSRALSDAELDYYVYEK